MTKQVRFTVRLDDEVATMLDEISARHERDKGAMIRWLIRIAHSVGDVGKCSSHVRQVCVSEASAVRQVSDGGSYPDPARAPVSSTPDQKEEKSKKEPRLAPLDIAIQIISDLNSQAGSSYHPKGAATRRLIALRMADGSTVEDFYTVHRKMTAVWKGSDMAKYLRPSTLYGSKFDEYLGAPEPDPAEAMHPDVARHLEPPDLNWGDKL